MGKRRDGYEGWTRQYEAAYERIFGSPCSCSGDCASFSAPGEPVHMAAIRGLRNDESAELES